MCGAEYSPAASYCSSCGAPVRDGADVLDPLGAGTNPRPTLQEAEPEPPRRTVTFITAVVALAVLALAGRSFAGRVAGDEDTAPPTAAIPGDEISASTSTQAPPSTTTSRPGRFVDGLPGPLFENEIGAFLVSTNFDGRIIAVDLDTSELIASRIRTGSFIVFDGRLLTQTGCGGWTTVNLPTMSFGEEVIGCGDYQPLAQTGGATSMFAQHDPSGPSSVLIADGTGGTIEVVADVATSVFTPLAHEQRLLLDVPGAGLVWFDGSTGLTEPYADGQLIGAGATGVVWSTCTADLECSSWFGTPSEPRSVQLDIDLAPGTGVARLAPNGSVAIFFPNSGTTVQVIDLATGISTRIEGAGIDGTGSDWSPDGRWIFDQADDQVRSLELATGRTVDFTAVPGDVSPGWLSLIAKPPAD